MITKAIIEEIVNDHCIKVRIPYMHKADFAPGATAVEDLPYATVNTIPGSIMNYAKGDVVFVGFEDHYANKPVILGQLSRVNSPTQYPELKANSINVTVDAYLPTTTFIGDVTAEEIQNLKGLNQNLQLQLDILSQQIAKLNDKLHTHRYGCLIGNRPTEEDANLILSYSVHKVTLLPWQIKAADINNDGVADSDDALIIQKYVDGQDVSKTRINQEFIYYDEDEQ